MVAEHLCEGDQGSPLFQCHFFEIYIGWHSICILCRELLLLRRELLPACCTECYFQSDMTTDLCLRFC